MSDFHIRVWGVRGSTPAAGKDTIRYGGETTCFEVEAGGSYVIVDCGSGARKLGDAVIQRPCRHIDMMFTHTHLDHICGLPFFKPAYDPRFQIDAWSGQFKDPDGLRDAICRIMSPPVFPVTANRLKAIQFKQFSAGDEIVKKGGLTIKTIALNHPDGACGYRFEYDGHATCIITDHEMGHKNYDDAIEAFIEGADVVFYDGMYTNAEYRHFIGYGHSSWEHVIETCTRANVKVPVIFHHDPCRSDDELDAILKQAKARHHNAEVAYEGMTFSF
ncbi:MBL fold metallo-hydrolase [Rhodobacteraceae bacterium RKSG542]|uniref:MBL fold metallo-hydrolase n=1 Tax=Pseudovibrio flavus TaxID=2529854 RepID=UPI00352785F3|nr:MBL fold metallo-hydrolase [Pseudovibrio flavus]